jgi:acylaminoacyl-peptidase
MKRVLLVAILSCAPRLGAAETGAVPVLQPMDLFSIEYASDPQVSPDGSRVVYVRNFMDVMKDN